MHKTHISHFAIASLSCISLFCSPSFAEDKKDKAKNNDEIPVCCSPQQVSKAFTWVAKKATPAVVFIKVQGGNAEEEGTTPYPDNFQNPYDPFGDDFFNRFFGMPPKKQKQQPQMMQGSGFIVSADGYIMTNNHVVKGADKITIVLNDGKEMDATVVGCDTHTDIAILKIEGKNFPFVKFGDIDQMEVGEWVVAIGSPFQLEASLTVGVISAKGRQNLRITDYEDFIQTDAAINPGNSGGPLLNLKGEVIGINTAIVSRSGGYMGIGFAIPSNMAKNIMTQIIDKGAVTRAFMGVSLQPVDKDLAEAFGMEKPEGALISEVMKDSPADKAGLKQGDIVLEFNNLPVKSLGSFRNDVSMMEPGKTVSIKVNRKGKILKMNVTLGTASDNIAAAGNAYQKLGFEVEDMSPERAKQLGINPMEEGVIITKVKPGSPGALAGMRPGFLILAINHKKVTNVKEFNDALTETDVKKRILILVKQGNATRFYSFKVE
jgi:serine protease Do